MPSRTMISFQSVITVMLVTAATANAAAVSPSASPFTITEASPSVGFPDTIFPSASGSPVVSSVIGSVEPSTAFPTTSTFSGTEASPTVSGIISSAFTIVPTTSAVEPITSVVGPITSAVTSLPGVATSTAVFTFTYVPVSTVTVTEYCCPKLSSSVIHPTTKTVAHPTGTIVEPIYTVTSVLPVGVGTISAVTFAEPSASATIVSVLPEGSGGIVTSIVVAQPTTSFAS